MVKAGVFVFCILLFWIVVTSVLWDVFVVGSHVPPQTFNLPCWYACLLEAHDHLMCTDVLELWGGWPVDVVVTQVVLPALRFSFESVHSYSHANGSMLQHWFYMAHKQASKPEGNMNHVPPLQISKGVLLVLTNILVWAAYIVLSIRQLCASLTSLPVGCNAGICI